MILNRTSWNWKVYKCIIHTTSPLAERWQPSKPCVLRRLIHFEDVFLTAHIQLRQWWQRMTKKNTIDPRALWSTGCQSFPVDIVVELPHESLWFNVPQSHHHRQSSSSSTGRSAVLRRTKASSHSCGWRDHCHRPKKHVWSQHVRNHIAHVFSLDLIGLPHYLC